MGEITATGLAIPSVEDLNTIQREEQRGDIDPNLSNEADTLIGNLNGIQSSHGREAWEAIQVAFNALDPDAAEGVLLDGLMKITGSVRQGATKSRFVGTKALTVNLSPGATVTKDVTAFSVAGHPEIRFFATKTVSNGTLIAANFPVEAAAEFTGPITANAGTVTVIATPTTGVNSVTNAFDAIKGTDVEKDGPARRRRERELRKQGSCTGPALAARLAEYTDGDGAKPVLSAVVLQNKTDFLDANGIKPHSFLPIIWDRGAAADADINAIVEANSPMGNTPTVEAPLLAAFLSGITPGNRFARPVETPFVIALEIEADANTYAGDTALKSALVAQSEALQTPVTEQGTNGEIAFSWYVGAALGVAGVKRVVSVTITPGGGTPVVNADAYPLLNQVATLEAADVTITTV